MQYKKKLIEVALPLEAINRESAREKSIRHGHPSTLHLWWARRPLAACRAVLWASLVDDPSAHPDKFPTEEAQAAERQRLFRILEELVKWDNSNNERVLGAARAEILRSTDGTPPPVLDPFCGGGSIPLEAQRLGLEAHASDINPVAVLITKTLIEIPPQFADSAPVNPELRNKIGGDANWKRATGLAEDVRYYGRWMRDEAFKRVGHLYPKVILPPHEGGSEATVIAWLWARAVRCPNPACGAQMPLVRSFQLSTNKDKKVWVEPIVNHEQKGVRFEVREGEEPKWAAAGASFIKSDGKRSQAAFRCVCCGNGPVKGDYIDGEAGAGRITAMPLAIVADGPKGRLYLNFTDPNQLDVAGHQSLRARARISEHLPNQHSRGTFAGNAQGRIYGFKGFADYFTARQSVAMATFNDLVSKVAERVLADGRAAGLADDGQPLQQGGSGAKAYAEAVETYLGLVTSKTVVFHNSLARWRAGENKSAPAFGRQAITMVWDFAEVNPFAGAGGDFDGVVDGAAKVLSGLPATPSGFVKQSDARKAEYPDGSCTICTDPPYYDNIGYADLSDFFYVWLRRCLAKTWTGLFETVLTPKATELIASRYRFGGDAEQARQHFETGLRESFERMRNAQHPDYPLSIFYAFKQAESHGSTEVETGTLVSTGWETMLEGLLQAGFAVTGTWPSRTEGATRMIAMGTNALASSVVLVCRQLRGSAPLGTRREFLSSLRAELAKALRTLQQGSIAPVDLAQAAIGPGMAIFSRYSKVLESDGSRMPVRTALALINQVL